MRCVLGLATIPTSFHAEGMKSTVVSLLIIVVAIITARAQAEKDLSAVNQEALTKTKSLMLNPEERESALARDPKARQADTFTQKVGGAQKENIYELATKVFERLVKKYDGDVDKMKAVIEKAQQDPSGFATTEFSPDEIKILKEISSRLPSAETPK